MNIARKVAVAFVTAALSIGLVSFSAPAQADSGWPARCGISCTSGR